MNANECVELMKKTTHKTTWCFDGSVVEVWIGYVDLTYDMAVALLTLSQGNFRGITRGRVNKYKSVIREDQWMLHHQGISVTSSESGHCDTLGDGQHRLKAFVEVCEEDNIDYKPLSVQVSIGLPDITQRAVDQQQKRTAEQILKFMGLSKGSLEIAGAARIVVQHFNATRFDKHHFAVSDQGLCDFVMRHEQKWIQTLEMVSKPETRMNIYPRTQMMALVFIATGATVHRIHWSNALDTFIAKFWEGLRIETKEDPFFKLRWKIRQLSNKDEHGKKDPKKRQWSLDRAKLVWESWNRFAKSESETLKVPQLGRIDHPLNVRLIPNVEHFSDSLFDELPNYERFKTGQNIRQQKNKYGRGWS